MKHCLAILPPLLAFILGGCSHHIAEPSAAPASAPAAVPAPDAYQLVWSDEFNVDGPLNSADWAYEKGFVRNEELQWYQPENARCAGGNLVIEARREHVANPNFVAGSTQWRTSRPAAEYTSASVTTKGRHEWLYGRFEIRRRIDTRQGSWPAFWTLGTTGRWPACGEVDVMEFYKNTLLANVAWLGDDKDVRWRSVRTPLAEMNDPEWSAKFHVWLMEWSEHEIALYCDDRLLNSVPLSETLNASKPGDNPFHRPMYVLLNQAIGGQGGDPAKTDFPVRYEIDYLRVYQRPSQMLLQKAAETQAK